MNFSHPYNLQANPLNYWTINKNEDCAGMSKTVLCSRLKNTFFTQNRW